MGDDKFTFVEGVRNPNSCTLFVQGPNDHTIEQVKDAIHDGLRAVKNAIEDGGVVEGAGAFEIAAHSHLDAYKKKVSGKPRLGVEIFANAMLVVPRVLIDNSGLDVQEKLLALIGEHEKTQKPVGIDIMTGDAISPAMEGVYD